MLPNLYILNNTGDVLIAKDYIGQTKRYICELFWEEVTKCKSQLRVEPIIPTENYYLISIRRCTLFFLTALKKDHSPLLIIEILHKIIDILLYYFKEKLTETIIRENFALIYQLLDEVILGGFPFTTEMNQLTDMISTPSMVSKLKDNLTGSFRVKETLPSAFHNSKIPWRKNDCKYVTNEIKIDVIEAIDCILQSSNNASTTDKIITSSINGSLECSVKLTGSPDLSLNFNNNNRILSDNNIQLHRCLRISRWIKDKHLSFVPPDGKFTLCKYRLKYNTGKLPLDINAMIKLSNKTNSTVKISLKKNLLFFGGSNSSKDSSKGGGNSSDSNKDKSIDKVLLEIPFPNDTLSFSLSCNYGKVTQDEITKIVRWHIGKYPKEKIPTLEGSVSLPSDWTGIGCNPTVRVGFEIKGLSMSNLKVDSLAVHNVKYKPFKGVRHITKAGVYLIRCE